MARKIIFSGKQVMVSSRAAKIFKKNKKNNNKWGKNFVKNKQKMGIQVLM